MQCDPLPSITSAADAIFKEVQASSDKPSQISQDQLSRLHFLFDKDLSKALQIVDRGNVKCFIAERSGRSVFQVQGSRQGDHYTVFPQHYCSCQAFLYSVVGHGHPVCKHQLAARIAQVLQRCQIQTVPDEVLAELLLTF